MRRVPSARGAVFFLCRRAESDPAFPRYPRLPRLSCPGYDGAGQTASMMESRRLERGGLVTAYAIEGAGPPVLLIHGAGARLDAWDGVVAALGGRFTTIRFDLRGHGDSSKPPGPYSAALFAEDALALLDHVGIGRCHVAGHSLDATVALRLALDAPDRVERLALLSAAAGRTEEERQRVLDRLAIVEHGIPG